LSTRALRETPDSRSQKIHGQKPSARVSSHNICERREMKMKRVLFLVLALMAIVAPLATVAYADYSTDKTIQAP